MDRGNVLVENLRKGDASSNDVENYYAWIDEFIEEQYNLHGLEDAISVPVAPIESELEEPIVEFYDLLGRRVYNVRDDSIIRKKGRIGIVLN